MPCWRKHERFQDRNEEPRHHLHRLPHDHLPILPNLEVHLRKRHRSPVPAGGLRRHRLLCPKRSRQPRDVLRREADRQELPRARLRPLRIILPPPQGESRLTSALSFSI